MENSTKIMRWQNTPGRIRTFDKRIRKALKGLFYRIGHRFYSFIQVVLVAGLLKFRNQL